MPARTKIHVGLEIGTSKTCLVVGEIKTDGAVKILGIGETKSVGVRRGEITDFTSVRHCLKEALAKAENNSDVEIGSVYLAISGAHFHSTNHSGTFRLPDSENIVQPNHLEEAMTSAREIPIPPEHVYLHTIIRHYGLDGMSYTSSPLGLNGKTVEAHFHIVHGIKSRIQNVMQLVREVPLELDDVVFSPIATAQMALDLEQRQHGALVIDIGGGTTDYALYLDGAIAASGCIPVGGDHITNDIHLVTGLPFSQAELLKINEGEASGDPAKSLGTARLIDERGFAQVEIQRSTLNNVIHQRLEETLHLVLQNLPDGSVNRLGSGVYLTGGTSMMRGISELAYRIFGRDIYKPESSEFTDDHSSFRDPRFATAIGLIRYAQIVEADSNPPPGFLKRLISRFWPF